MTDDLCLSTGDQTLNNGVADDLCSKPPTAPRALFKWT
jgi:hypothetical protein